MKTLSEELIVPSPKRSVLVVEDKIETRDLIGEFLTAVGISSVLVSSVDEAYPLLEQNVFDLLIVDWKLKGGSGAQVIQAARRINPLIPVIAISGVVDIDASTECYLAGADSFLQKPFAPNVLVHIVQLWLKRFEAYSQSFFPATLDEVLPFELLKEKYFKHVYELASRKATRASEALGVNRQTLSNIIKEAAPSET